MIAGAKWEILIELCREFEHGYSQSREGIAIKSALPDIHFIHEGAGKTDVEQVRLYREGVEASPVFVIGDDFATTEAEVLALALSPRRYHIAEFKVEAPERLKDNSFIQEKMKRQREKWQR